MVVKLHVTSATALLGTSLQVHLVYALDAAVLEKRLKRVLPLMSVFVAECAKAKAGLVEW